MKRLLFPILLLAMIATGCKPDEPKYNHNTGESGTQQEYAKAPEINFSVEVKQPLSIVLTDNSKYTYTQPIYTWDFGDGSTSTEKNPTHRYKAKGVYKVTLTINNGLYISSAYRAVTIENPTKCYVTGCQFDKVPYNNKYYYAKLNDDDLITGTWFTTQWQLLSSANLPFTYMFTKSTEMTGLSGDNYYTLYVYYSDSKSGNGTQCMKQKITTATEIYGAYPTSITKTSDNKETQVTVFFEWK